MDRRRFLLTSLAGAFPAPVAAKAIIALFDQGAAYPAPLPHRGADVERPTLHHFALEVRREEQRPLIGPWC